MSNGPANKFEKCNPITFTSVIQLYMHVQEEDTVLINMVLQGSQAAFGKLVDRYQGYVFSIALRYVRDRELAEELSQDVFVKAYKCLADFKGRSKFSTWLYTIVHTTCLSHTRLKTTRVELPGEEALHNMAKSQDMSFHPARKLEQATQKQLLERAMTNLADADAEIVTLFYMAEQSVEEIGVIVGLSPANVKVKLLRPGKN